MNVIIEHLINVILAGIMCVVVHEAGHYVTALIFGKKLKFRFSWGKLFKKIPIPRWIWTMPKLELYKQKTIAFMGFGAEFLFAVVLNLLIYPAQLGIIYIAIAIMHICLYCFYATDDTSDFKWL